MILAQPQLSIIPTFEQDKRTLSLFQSQQQQPQQLDSETSPYSYRAFPYHLDDTPSSSFSFDDLAVSALSPRFETSGARLSFPLSGSSPLLDEPPLSPSSATYLSSPSPPLMQSQPWLLSGSNSSRSSTGPLLNGGSSASASASSNHSNIINDNANRLSVARNPHDYHHRGSSISSLGSATTSPASPYAQTNIVNPQIAVTADSVSDDALLQDFMAVADDSVPFYHHLAKSMTTSPTDHAVFYPSYNNNDSQPGAASYAVASQGQRLNKQQQQQHVHHQDVRSLLSNAASIGSGSSGSDSPKTPPGAFYGRRQDNFIVNGQHNQHAPEESTNAGTLGHGRQALGFPNVIVTNPAPRFARTISDIYQDELYSPEFSTADSTSGSPPALSRVGTAAATLNPFSPSGVGKNSMMYTPRLQASNANHLGIPPSPASATRGRSPYKQETFDFGSLTGASQAGQFSPTASLQTRVKTEPVGAMGSLPGPQAPGTPQTISPKDALLEFVDTEPEAEIASLFPAVGAQESKQQQLQKTILPNLASSAMLGIMVPQQYPFIPRAQDKTATSQPNDLEHDTSSIAEPSVSPLRPQRPHAMAKSAAVGSEKGTYSCTYHRCPLRFESQALLQRHKREGHRQVHGPHSLRHHRMGMTEGEPDTQSGPHRCDRINPSTNKPCHVVFSRPYDLTRHEGTIHARKCKVRCHLCPDKTFSRGDALTRHFRVCHPEIELNTKRAKKRGSSGSEMTDDHLTEDHPSHTAMDEVMEDQTGNDGMENQTGDDQFEDQTGDAPITVDMM